MNETVVWDIDRARRVVGLLRLLLAWFAVEDEDVPDDPSDLYADVLAAIADLRDHDLDLPA